jgi:hypothetical protein
MNSFLSEKTKRLSPSKSLSFLYRPFLLASSCPSSIYVLDALHYCITRFTGAAGGVKSDCPPLNGFISA